MECGSDSRLGMDGKECCPERSGPSAWKISGGPRRQPAGSGTDHRVEKRKRHCPEWSLPPSRKIHRPPSCQPAMECRTDGRFEVNGAVRCPECAGPFGWENAAQLPHPTELRDGCRGAGLCGCGSWMGEQHVVASIRCGRVKSLFRGRRGRRRPCRARSL
jgi:hypothetical protein